MTRSDHAEAARRLLTRLVTVVAVVAGLVVLLAPLCGDGMSTMPVGDAGSATGSAGAAQDQGPMLAVSGSSCDAIVVRDAAGAHCGPETASLLPSPFQPLIPSGAFLVCIAIVIAILPVVLALRPPWSVRADVIRLAAEPQGLFVRPAQHPSLTELCVLRT